MDHFYSESLSSLNETELRPRRTSYGSMSTWFFLKDNPRQKTEIFYDMGDVLVKKRPTTTVIRKQPRLPEIVKEPFNVRKTIDSVKNEEYKKNVEVRDFLMKNWTQKLADESKFEKNWSREGRGGGVWNNVRESLKSDGNRLLFIHGGAKSYQNLQKSNRYKDFGCFVHEYRMPTIPVEKLEREKLNVQTKHSVEFGNWNIVR